MKSLIITLVACALGFVPGAFAQDSSKSSSDTHHERMKHGESDSCEHMMKMHQQVQERMQAMDDELSTLVQKMNQAQGQEKVDAIASVVNKELEQRKEMRTMMAKEHRREMRHAMGHMQRGDMAKCPMAGDADEAAGAEKPSELKNHDQNE